MLNDPTLSADYPPRDKKRGFDSKANKYQVFYLISKQRGMERSNHE